MIAIWSGLGRDDERPRERARDNTSSAELAAMVESLKLYTADQVDVPARQDSTAPVRPLYPDSLYTARVEGGVVAEFVVDTTGRVALDAFGVVSSTHPLFTDAVRRALPEARFFPAQRGGRAVRQLVQQPFRFVIADSAAPHRPRGP